MSSYRPIRHANTPPAPPQYEEVMFCKTTVRVDEAGGIILENSDDFEPIQVSRTWQADRRNGKINGGYLSMGSTKFVFKVFVNAHHHRYCYV